MRSFLIVTAIAALVACKKEAEDRPASPASPTETVPVTAEATGSAALAAGAEAADKAAALAARAGERAAVAGEAAAARVAEAGAAVSQAGAAALAAGEQAVAAGEQALDKAAGVAADRAASAAEAAAGAAERAAGAAEQAAAAAARMSVAAGTGTEPPADFPLPIPSGVRGRFSERVSDGQRTRTAVFAYPGSADELAAQYEEAMKKSGFEPEVKKTPLGEARIVSVKARKGAAEAKAVITTAKSGTSQVTIVWREASP